MDSSSSMSSTATDGSTRSSSHNESRDAFFYMRLIRDEEKILKDLIKKGLEDLNIIEQKENSKNQLTEFGSEDDSRSGQLRVAIGKANILIKQKFRQFRKYGFKNIEHILKETLNDQYATRLEDVAGFYEVIMIQIEQIHDLFDQANDKGKGFKLGVDDQQLILQIPEEADMMVTPTPSSHRRIESTIAKGASPKASEGLKKMIRERRLVKNTKEIEVDEVKHVPGVGAFWFCNL